MFINVDTNLWKFKQYVARRVNSSQFFVRFFCLVGRKEFLWIHLRDVVKWCGIVFGLTSGLWRNSKRRIQNYFQIVQSSLNFKIRSKQGMQENSIFRQLSNVTQGGGMKNASKRILPKTLLSSETRWLNWRISQPLSDAFKNIRCEFVISISDRRTF